MTELLAEIEAFVARHKLEDSTFGRMVGDRHIVQQLRSGRRMWPETVARVRARMAAIDAARSGEPAAATPSAADRWAGRVVQCAVCERRLTDTTVRACQAPDCPQSEREAA